MVSIKKIDAVDQYDISQYERLMSQIPSFRMRGKELLEYVAKIVLHGTVLVVDEDATLRGFAGFYANDFQNRVAYWSSLVIDSSLRGQGWGTRMFDEVKALCRDAGMRVVHATVLKSNQSAQIFHQAHGFVLQEHESDPTRFRMELTL